MMRHLRSRRILGAVAPLALATVLLGWGARDGSSPEQPGWLPLWEVTDGSSTVLLGAATRRPGIHNVTLRLVDSTGTPLGASDSLPIRSAEVSNVIWVILGTGVVLLFGAIAVRLVRRLRAAAHAARQA